MPIYTYHCDACGHKDDEYQKMSSEPLTDCPTCKKPEYRKVPAVPHTNLIEFSTPIEMNSVACNSLDEIRDLKRSCPDVDISEDENDDLYGVPIARNRAQKLAVLKASGYVEKN